MLYEVITVIIHVVQRLAQRPTGAEDLRLDLDLHLGPIFQRLHDLLRQMMAVDHHRPAVAGRELAQETMEQHAVDHGKEWFGP